jgi:hypothetical protein
MSKLERGKRVTRREHFPREIGHKSQGDFCFGVVLCFLWYMPYCMDPYMSYNNKLGHGNRGILLHIFRGRFLSFLKEVSRTGRGYNNLFWATFYEV